MMHSQVISSLGSSVQALGVRSSFLWAEAPGSGGHYPSANRKWNLSWFTSRYVASLPCHSDRLSSGITCRGTSSASQLSSSNSGWNVCPTKCQRQLGNRSVVQMSSQNGQNEGADDSPEKDRRYVGLDFGTSGARVMVIDDHGSIQANAKRGYPVSFSGNHFSCISRLSSPPSLSLKHEDRSVCLPLNAIFLRSLIK